MRFVLLLLLLLSAVLHVFVVTRAVDDATEYCASLSGDRGECRSSLIVCPDEGSIRLSTDEMVRDLYDRRADPRKELLDFDEERGVQDMCRTFGSMNSAFNRSAVLLQAEAVARHLGLQRNQSYFDVGLGCGALAGHMRTAHGARIAGVDFAPAAIQFVREQHDGDFCVADAAYLDFVPDGSFDYSGTYHVLNYIETPELVCQSLQHMVRIVRDGGRVWIGLVEDDNLPASEYEEGDSPGFRTCFDGDEGDWHFTQSWLQQCLEQKFEPSSLVFSYVPETELYEGASTAYCAERRVSAFIERGM